MRRRRRRRSRVWLRGGRGGGGGADHLVVNDREGKFIQIAKERERDGENDTNRQIRLVRVRTPFAVKQTIVLDTVCACVAHSNQLKKNLIIIIINENRYAGHCINIMYSCGRWARS